MQVKIGCDPELFAFNENGEPVSVHDILPGNKAFPHKVPRGAIQVDGVAAEFNINPATTSKEFVLNIRHVHKLMSQILYNKNPNLKLRAVPTALFSQEYFDNLPEEAKHLGCEPDFSAYTLEANPKPETDRPFRTGSGHLHIQFRDPFVADPTSYNHMKDCAELTKQLDGILLPVSRFWDDDEERRTLYGAPGAFRPKKYGVEYRVLSNRWVEEEFLMRYVFDVSKAVTENFVEGDDTLSRVRRAARGTNTISSHVYAMSSVGLPDFNAYAPANFNYREAA